MVEEIAEEDKDNTVVEQDKPVVILHSIGQGW